MSPSALLTVSLFFHQNLADFEAVIASDYRDSRYAGAQATFANAGLRLGAFGFTQRDDVRFALQPDGGLASRLPPPVVSTGGVPYAAAREQHLGGTHFVDPRQVSLEARYRFRYWLTSASMWLM